MQLETLMESKRGVIQKATIHRDIERKYSRSWGLEFVEEKKKTCR